MPSPPPLECLRFFESAARHGSFVRAAKELEITSAAVAYRVKMLEEHLGHTLFDRKGRGVDLNLRGRSCLGDVQRVLCEVAEVIERHRHDSAMCRLGIVVLESIAETWLMPKLVHFMDTHPAIPIVLETDHLRADPNGNDFDIWITWSAATHTPGVATARHEALFEDTLFPVCSPVLLRRFGRPRTPAELHSWSLLYHLASPADWSQWFAAQGEAPPDLARASGFRLCSLLVRAAVDGLGAIMGRPKAITRELERGSLVPIFDGHREARSVCYLIIPTAAERKPEVRAFRDWIVGAADGEPAPRPGPSAAAPSAGSGAGNDAGSCRGSVP